ncbi:MAG: ThuA domain-containing protein [Bryobacterales bacterium]|nr:ThuA domain-containing protein [Bryobacterales bacterium]
MFTSPALKAFHAIVFSNTNNEAFASDAQREAFQAYIRGGGGFVGIHSGEWASERRWEWYWKMIGGSFDYHPPMQKFTVRVVNSNHPATQALPADSSGRMSFTSRSTPIRT